MTLLHGRFLGPSPSSTEVANNACLFRFKSLAFDLYEDATFAPVHVIKGFTEEGLIPFIN